jgi:hypothetical protein
VYRWRVLDHDHVLALASGIAQFGDGGRGIAQKASFVCRIGPGTRDHAGAVPGADLVLVVIDDRIQRCRIDKALLNQQGFKRLDSQRRVTRNNTVIMVMLMILAVEIVGTHDDILLANSCLLRVYA